MISKKANRRRRQGLSAGQLKSGGGFGGPGAKIIEGGKGTIREMQPKGAKNPKLGSKKTYGTVVKNTLKTGVQRTPSRQDRHSNALGYMNRQGSKSGGHTGRNLAIGVGAAAAAFGGYKAYEHFQGRKHADRDYSRPKVKRSARAKRTR